MNLITQTYDADEWQLVPKNLTAENGAKAALSGEFFETITRQCLECVDDESGDGCDSTPANIPGLLDEYADRLEAQEKAEQET